MATQTVTATFSNANTATVSWNAMAGNYIVIPGQATVTDSAGPVSVELTGVSSSGATVNTGAYFTGTVPLLILDV